MGAQGPARPEDWARLAKEIREARKALKLTQQELRDKGGPPVTKQVGLENGRVQELSLRDRGRLERALQWPPNHIDSILQGMRRPRLPPRGTRRTIVTAAHGRRWREALELIAENPCTRPARTCCCLVAGLPRGDWCSPCIAHHALRTTESEVPQ